ncbi:hypothetical protein [Chamaesiphon polymorphus]|uniref:Uncharacterized protein n=1 Tax=Chamaesiphon polymorphus CCALA 037 TaxID=2107692 RepID=A0A2T1FDY1_9CYAN|nr:hypothetical protein [Chamaesiphon polymorphus]PSB43217.1 hypothetical protein C7B77_26270 [Chamaesiphon polymorphus CCALA 037]
MKLPMTGCSDSYRSIANKTPRASNLQSLYSGVSELWQTLVAHVAGTGEPRVWQTRTEHDRQWNAYDPSTQQTLRQVSSQELRVWLETRHARLR